MVLERLIQLYRRQGIPTGRVELKRRACVLIVAAGKRLLDEDERDGPQYVEHDAVDVTDEGTAADRIACSPRCFYREEEVAVRRIEGE